MRPVDAQDQLLRRLTAEAERAEKTGYPHAGRFLSGEERSLANRAAKECGLKAAFSGGWADAERFQPCFHYAEDEPQHTALWLEIRWNTRFSQVTHRDLFGSLMGLGMNRSYFGDLVVAQDRAWLYCLPEVAVRLPSEWTQAGNTPIQVSVSEEEPVIEAPSGDMRRDTVASLRMDCVLAAGLNCSRAKAAEMIRQGSVQRNHQPCEHTDAVIAVGDVLSVRGFGRIRLREVGEATRKDRFPVLLEVFSSRK